MDRQAQFRARETLIFQVAEQLLLENGESGMTLDALAAELDLAKGTLYKHFQSKDELYMLLIIRNERMLLEMIMDSEKAFPEHLAFFMLHHLHHPERTVLFHQIEERLSITGQGIQHLFSELYKVRRHRLRLIINMTETYLGSIQSLMSVRDYLASIWSLTYGAAAILNSSFYQRYLGSRDTLRVAYIDQALALPKQVSS
ncbi:TetR/AcrR family transcriptional regulator [Acinetobacter tibetensis]|jgi:AcrR family transcriptional regulator|uniref:TetR/AcrR family transcriptional regulator n=1 Tax=Acinetobacter tibetensis TaxID=2943497 RepID=A0AAE9RZ18_9GAMM|nr:MULTISPECIES: TetR/AcrR family transcriptional regulator [Acinetobacter]HEX5381080.1 TetR/AcrR family transcriptional regulator [Acinetobacter sp.]PWB17112.1 TetR family transcriptional regulator [Acinetobacter sp. AM]TCB33042.1 TetR/AcrR family transcriptional regulator [Acinetobacter sp. ANC 4910]TCB77515.1 TetR/AcrR family transcriptional regulator [Acinetobacter sp. ANC 4173]USE82086.1 TetR/AcrR family transcriptional regulator [Acinetobacter tibetensis]